MTIASCRWTISLEITISLFVATKNVFVHQTFDYIFYSHLCGFQLLIPRRNIQCVWKTRVIACRESGCVVAAEVDTIGRYKKVQKRDVVLTPPYSPIKRVQNIASTHHRTQRREDIVLTTSKMKKKKKCIGINTEHINSRVFDVGYSSRCVTREPSDWESKSAVEGIDRWNGQVVVYCLFLLLHKC